MNTGYKTGWRPTLGQWPISNQLANYTLASSDAGSVVEMNNASANNLTVPPNSQVAFPIGAEVRVFQYGAGATTIVAGTGVTVNSLNGQMTLAGRYAWATLIKRAVDEWDMSFTTQAGVELASAELDTTTANITTTIADVTGFSITFNAPSGSFMVRVFLGSCSIPNAAEYIIATLADGSNTAIAVAYPTVATGGYIDQKLIEVRLPRTGSGAYSITPGTSYTFKLRAQTSTSTATISAGAGLMRSRIQAVTL